MRRRETAPGHTGPLCGVCKRDGNETYYYAPHFNQCMSCANFNAAMALPMVVFVAIIAGLMASLWKQMLKLNAPDDIPAKLRDDTLVNVHSAAMPKIKIVFAFVQVRV